MSLLKHSLLKRLARNIDLGISPLRWIDLYSAQYISDCQQEGYQGEGQQEVVALAVLVSFASSSGETYLSLANLPKNMLSPFEFPDLTLTEWTDKLSCSSAIRVVPRDSLSSFPLELVVNENVKQAPLVLWAGRLYLARYWQFHQKWERWLHEQSLVECEVEEPHLPILAGQIHDVFQFSREESSSEVLNWQVISAAHTLLQHFSLITGGPGTGKTTTAASLLYLLMQRNKLTETKLQSAHLSVKLLAPTGKAAIKLADSIRHHLQSIESRLLGSDLKSIRMSDCLPKSGETIHRFLYEQGALRESLNQDRLFDSEEVLLGEQESRKALVDIVVIDEASMIDLALMVELIQVIPASAQVIMLGDHHQLPAVEPGQVFSECVARYAHYRYSPFFSEQLSLLSGFNAESIRCESALSKKDTNENHNEAVFHPVCQLRKTYRFGGDLKTAAEQIKLGQNRAFKQQFNFQRETQEQVVSWHSLSGQEQAGLSMVSDYSNYFECLKTKPHLSDLVIAFDQFQLLCSTHEGPLGVTQMNELIETQFIYQHEPHRRYGSGFYHGKAILVTRNHAHLGVFNGDVGFVIADACNPSNWQIHFPVQNQSALVVAPGRLREWQPAYAMTVHKSQGSEYQHVGVILAGYAKELLSRALLYTALTRSKLSCDIWASSESLDQAFK